MSGGAETEGWPWFVSIELAAWSTVVFLALYAIGRKRRWRDRTLLGRAVIIAPEHMERTAKEVRDLRAGDEGWVSCLEIVTSKRGRVFVRWTATLQEAPTDPESQFAPLRIVRLKRGFSLALRPGLEFRSSPLPLGDYGPVIKITQDAGGRRLDRCGDFARG